MHVHTDPYSKIPLETKMPVADNVASVSAINQEPASHIVDNTI